LQEYFAVTTNPRRVRAATTIAEAWDDVETFLANFRLIQPLPDHVNRLMALGRTLDVKGPELFDLSIAVTGLGADVHTVYTFDDKIFSKVPGITVRTP
jgi:hypothetical protein